MTPRSVPKSLLGLDRRTFLRSTILGTSALAAQGLGSWSYAQGEKVLTIALPNNPSTFDPVNQANHDAMVISQCIFENLIEVDVDGKLVPKLATKLPAISEDRLVYTLDLRDDVTFQNGAKFTAEDVKYSFDYLLNPDNKALRKPLFDKIKNIIVESPTRIRFELREPYRPWLFYLTKYMGIFPKGSREQHDANYFKSNPLGVGTGPGVFVEWKQNDYITLKKNPNYWRKGVPDWDRLVVRIIPEDSTRVAYLMTGDLDIIGAPPPKDFVRLRSGPNVKGDAKLALGGWFFLMLNNKTPPFDDVNVRKAMSHAIDRASIAKNIYYGLVEPAGIPAPPGSWWFNAEADASNGFDLEKAKAYLQKSKVPNGFEFDMLVPSQPYLLDVKDAALAVQAQLAKLDIRSNQKLMEQGVLLQQLRLGNHVSALQVWMSPGEPTFMIDLIYGKDNTFTKSAGYENATVLQAIRDSYRQTEEKELKPIFARMLKQLADDSPHIWMGFAQATNLWRDNIVDFKVNQGLTMRVQDVKKKI